MAKQTKIYIEGMHCASCEILIEKKFLKKDGINFADASTKSDCLVLKHNGKYKVNFKEINKEFEELGYTFSNKKAKRKKDAPMIKFNQDGSVYLNKVKFQTFTKNLFAIIAVLILVKLIDSSGFGQKASLSENSSYVAFAILGLVASISSCAALVGGILLSLTKKWNDMYIDKSTATKSEPHIYFHTGRLLGFAIFGGLLGAFGTILGKTNIFSNTLFFASLIIVISIIMLILALQMLEIDWARNISIKLPKSISNFAATEDRGKGRFIPLFNGVLTFFLPCGFTLSAMSIALLSGSLITGALQMLFFALGTLPMLLFISFSGIKLNSKPHLTAIFNKLAGVLLIIFAIYNINAQFNVLGIKSLSDIDFSFKSSSSITITETAIIIDEDGIQRLKIDAEGFSYIPTNGTVLTAGVPAILEVNNKGIQGCGAYMAARGLFDGSLTLNLGLNSLNFTPTAGTYKLTCTMGMVRPVIIKVI